MPRRSDEFVTGLVLAAGGSKRLGRPKQLLPYAGGTLLGHVVETARASRFDQLVVALGGSADKVRERVDLHGADIALNPDFGEGCSSSIAAALSIVDPACDLLVLMLGDQPAVTAQDVAALVERRGDASIAICRYDDGPGHPIAFARELFPELGDMHGDKAVWKLLDRHQPEVVEVRVPGPIPLDIDTWEDYEAVVR